MKVTKIFTTCEPHGQKTLANHWILNKDTNRNLSWAQNQKTKQTCEHLAQDMWPREEDGVPVLILPERAFCCGFSCRKNFTCTHWYVNDVHVKFKLIKIWRLAAGRIRAGRSSPANGLSTVSRPFLNRFWCQPESCWVRFRVTNTFSRFSRDLAFRQKKSWPYVS